MGLRMDNIHTPTVPLGPITGCDSSKDSAEVKLPLMDLIAEKDRVESELSALSRVLDSVCIVMN